MMAAGDEQHRAKIRNELRSTILVEASAGTGKTWCIVDRMVNLIAAGECEIHQLAAMTFTRKAAAEMRERFYNSLRRKAADEEDLAKRKRLLRALAKVEHAFIGTIHSFCGMMIRERPIEFGVDPNFHELDDGEDQELVQEAWRDFLNRMHDSDDSRLAQIREYGLRLQDLKSCFATFIEFPDVDEWPDEEPGPFDVDGLKEHVQAYIEEMRRLQPLFPASRHTDKLMDRYDEIVRKSDHIQWRRLGEFFDLVELFDHGHECTLKYWHDSKVARQQRDQWEAFRDERIRDAMHWWRGSRYALLIQLLRDAARIYDQLRDAAAGLSFQDLLLKVADALRDQPELRRYFQSRFTHLLVDEFQDTDPIQARILAMLASDDAEQRQWTACHLRRGALFLVGDPKQSIYRFRRADITTYRQMKQVVLDSDGAVLPLTNSFRSVAAIREWCNDTFRELIGDVENDFSPAAAEMEQGRENACEGEMAGVRVLSIPAGLRRREATVAEAQRIAAFIHAAIRSQATIPRTQQELDDGSPSHVEPSDFLIVAWRKDDLPYYAEALNRLGVANDVAGASAFESVEELRILRTCLQVVDDPTNPIPYVALLRSDVFGFNDEDLYRYRCAGGAFSYRSLPDRWEGELRDRFADVNERLVGYLRLLRQLPFAVAAEQIAVDLGLQARCAAAPAGEIALGGFLKAIEWIRAESWRFDSARDMITFIDQLYDGMEAEPCAARSHTTSAVRIMNLHKAKGLESSVVFLAGAFGKFREEFHHHVSRQGDITRGYLSITKPRSSNPHAGVRPVAQPANWDEVAGVERRFHEAEVARLLYVAATRAKTMLVVSQRDAKNYSSRWGPLDPFLEAAPRLTEPPRDSNPLEDEHSTSIDEMNEELVRSEAWQSFFSLFYAFARCLY